ncbi:hypothetical protein A2686_03810 [Candidatus Woesebacteria bacterium RIFCSPHIGHO2_01_FULL_38_10]|uniref:Uncharacterized protein n=1 Tax=Candidatus Woesebacteria bacterium RIFCSPLOWO2_01_FULL_39_10b TaxID=1802517 RepID=A0A1F8B860_9BACT|nr:MAG: hypothetical protein A2686_03810 [Candidatus Woesebacteria bacterium RIFCSPHIGHO2_01_FULL_38_10]OGM59889.1 MAG: hypothetical protein A2892_02805 [Candidatus Woesebacteria bacterium RIFCSPLOWO2_01_FULL_39_10b]
MVEEDEKLHPKYDLGQSPQSIPDWIVNGANLINRALGKGRITLPEASEGLLKEQDVHEMMGKSI